MHCDVTFRILGPLEVVADGPPVPLGPRQSAVLATLLLNANRVVSVGRIIDAVWPHPTPAAASNLRTHVAALRRRPELGSRLGSRTAGYVIRADPHELDLLAFAGHTAQGDAAAGTGDTAKAEHHYGRALALWSGSLLDGLVFGPALHPVLTALNEQRLAAAEHYVDARLALGQLDGLPVLLRSWIEEEPLRERLWAQLMIALYGSGRQAAALAAFTELRDRLVTELGVEPSPALCRLQGKMLAADPDLSSPEWTLAPPRLKCNRPTVRRPPR